MTDHDALLRAICENPADDTSRLVFADWLDDHADSFPTPAAVRARAAFIRDDIAMSLREEFDPLRLRWELIEKPRREAEAWVKKALPPEIRVSPPTGERLFSRGFPWYVPLSPTQFLASADRILTGVPSAVLTYRVADASTASLFCSSHFARVSGLRVQFSNLSADTIEILAESKQATALEELHGGYGGLAANAIQTLLRSDLFLRLARLTLNGRRWLGSVLTRDIQRVPGPTRLHELNLAETGISRSDIEPLLAAPAVRTVTRLSLARCALWRAGHEILARTDLPLRHLDVSETSPGPDGFRAFSTSGVLANLNRLVYRGNHINGTLLGELATCHEVSNLRVLNLASNAIGNDGATALSRSPHFAGLLVLNLQHCMVGDEGIEAILESPLAENLVLLDLRGSPASEEMKEVLKAKMGDRVRL
jgi:uncharacterized protein (TIGR02996 family)